jgi:RNA polymerase sigma factor (sigma-70 family)
MPEPEEVAKAEKSLVENLPRIERIVRAICRRTIPPDDVDEFWSYVQLRLVENDYSILRRYGERSPFEAYMATVASRLLQDFLRHEKGRWHPSETAKRAGEIGIQLEALVYRDGRSHDEAYEVLKQRHPALTRQAFEALVSLIPARASRRLIPLEELPVLLFREASVAPERLLMAAEVSSTIRRRIAAMEALDQLILRLHFDTGMTVAEMARSLGRDQQWLYARLRALGAKLRRSLIAAGFSANDLALLVDQGLLDIFKSNDDCPSQ